MEIGDEFGPIYERYASLVHNRCRRYLGSEEAAWDAVQEIFLKLMEHWKKIEKKDSLLFWLQRTTTHHCLSELRKKKTEPLNEEIHSPDPSSNPEKDYAISENLERLFAPWNKAMRDIVSFTYIDGYTQPEIAKMMGMGESTVRKYLTRFRRKARMAEEEEKGT